MRTHPIFAVLAVVAVAIGAIVATRARADVTTFTTTMVSTKYVLGSNDGLSWTVTGTCGRFPISDAGFGPEVCAGANQALGGGANTAIQAWNSVATPLIKAQNGL